MDAPFLKKYQGFEYREKKTLFDIEPFQATHNHVCPHCGKKLTEMRFKPMVWCKYKKCPARMNGETFVMRKELMK